MPRSLAASSRRDFLRQVFLLAGASATLPLLAACGGGSSSGGLPAAVVAGRRAGSPGRFANLGPLGEPDALGLRLPAGFSARIVAESLQPVAGTSYPWHIFPDGGGVMPRADGGWYYISNSEVPGFGSLGFTVPQLAPLGNPLERLTPGLGGASAIEFAADGSIVAARRILSGTTFNCSGCVTPWQTWLSCEEIPEGQVWECDPGGQAAAVARPTLGLFAHEATAVDAARQVIYMTEDMPDGRFYRWLPAAGDWPAGGRPAFASGRLQVLQVTGAGIAATLDGAQPVVWRDALAPEQAQMDHRRDDSTAFNGGEGLWIHDDYAFFSTKGDNRIWAYDIRQQTLEVIYDLATSDNPILSGVDNITVTDQGDILVAEDGGDMQIVVLLPDGSLKPLLQITGQDQSEVAGIAFSPDGRRLYFTSDRGGRTPAGSYSPGFGLTYELLLPPGL